MAEPYIAIRDEYLSSLEDKVCEKVREAYSPCGGITTALHEGIFFYIQAMIHRIRDIGGSQNDS